MDPTSCPLLAIKANRRYHFLDLEAAHIPEATWRSEQRSTQRLQWHGRNCHWCRWWVGGFGAVPYADQFYLATGRWQPLAAWSGNTRVACQWVTNQFIGLVEWRNLGTTGIFYLMLGSLTAKCSSLLLCLCYLLVRSQNIVTASRCSWRF